MRRVFLLLLFLSVLACSVYAQIKEDNVLLTIGVSNYQRPKIYVDCVQTPLIHAEFHNNGEQKHTYRFNLEDMAEVLINGNISVFLMPGDSLVVSIVYEGKNMSKIDYWGNEQAVRNNDFYRSVNGIKKELRYKSQLLANAVLNITPQERMRVSDEYLLRVKEIVSKSEGVSNDVKEYIMAGVEADVYLSYMEYPLMYEELRKKSISEQGIGEYWDIMQGFRIRDGKGALLNPNYLSMLMRYSFFMNEKNSHEKGIEYQRPQMLEGMYTEFAATYDGDIRDAVLYTLLTNFIRSGKEIERVDPLLRDYKEKYNKNSRYIEIIESLLR